MKNLSIAIGTVAVVDFASPALAGGFGSMHYLLLFCMKKWVKTMASHRSHMAHEAMT